MRLTRKSHFWLAAAAAAAYLFFSLLYLELPGLEHDEMIFVNAALGNRDNTFIDWSVRVGGIEIPVMVMRYIGAVKPYIYAPVFAVFGTSPWTARFPVVIFGLVTLAMTYGYVRILLGPRVALWSCILLATDPTFIYSNRLDWGPVSLMMVFKSAVLVLLLRWIQVGHPAFLALAALIAGIGLFDKIVFIWFLGALALAFPLCFWSRIRPRIAPWTIAAACACFLGGCAPLIAYNIQSPWITFQGHKGLTDRWGETMRHRYQLTKGTFNGEAVLAFTTGHSVGTEFEKAIQKTGDGIMDLLFTSAVRWIRLRSSFTAIAFLFSTAIISILWWRSAMEERRSLLFVIFLLLIIFIFICMTAEAGGSHHVMMMYPFHLILIAYAFCRGTQFFETRGGSLCRLLPRAAMGAGMAAVVAAAITINIVHLKSFKSLGGSGPWSDAIYRLADHMRQRPDRTFLLMDWGFSSQLLVMNSARINYREVYPRITALSSRQERIAALHPFLVDPKNLFVFHTTRFATEHIFGDFIAAAHRFGLELNFGQPFRQRDGRHIYFVAEVVPPGAASGLPQGGPPYNPINPEVLGFQENSRVKMEADPKEVRAGVDTLHLAVKNLDAPAIDLYYTLNGEAMPILLNWKLNQDHSVSMLVGRETPKGLYVYKAIRNALDDSPMAWHKVDLSILVR